MPKIVASKEDWIKLGYMLFSESGIAGLNVDKMSRHLKCNKSSFYWHFGTKAEFVDCIIEHWTAIDTTQIIELVQSKKSPRSMFLLLIEMAFKKDANLDFIFFLKRYVQDKEQLRLAVEKNDLERIYFVQNLIIKLGYSNSEAKLKANLFYKYLIGYHEMIRYKKQPKSYVKEVVKELGQFINLDK